MGKSYTPLQFNWRWWYDNAVTPVSPYASQNTRPPAADWRGIVLRLRFNIAETGDANGGGTIELEWSDDDSTWYAMGSSQAWQYADGMATDGATLTTLVIGSSDEYGLYCESGSNSISQSKSSFQEEDFAITPGTGLTESTYYYFRVKVAGTPLGFFSSATHPTVEQDEFGATTYPVDGTAACTSVASLDVTATLGVAPSTTVSTSGASCAVHVDSISIERKTGSGGSYAEIARAEWADATWTDTTPESGNTYYYKARRYTDDVYSNYGNEDSVVFVSGTTYPVDGTAVCTSGSSIAATRLAPVSGTAASTSGSSLDVTATLVASGTAACTSTASIYAPAKLVTSGTCVATSGSSLDAHIVFPISGTCVATSGSSCDAVKKEYSASGTFVCTSTASAAVTAKFVAAGTAAASSTTSLDAVRTTSVSGTVTCTSGASCDASAKKYAAGTAAASSDASAAVTATFVSSGTAVASATSSASVTATLVASGTCVSTSGASLTVFKKYAVDGTAVCTSGTTCDATKIAGGTYPVSGTVACTSATSGDVTATFVAAGAAVATSSSTLTVTATFAAEGTAVASSTSSLDAIRLAPISGTCVVTSQSSLAVTATLTMAGTVAAVSGFTLGTAFIVVNIVSVDNPSDPYSRGASEYLTVVIDRTFSPSTNARIQAWWVEEDDDRSWYDAGYIAGNDIDTEYELQVTVPGEMPSEVYRLYTYIIYDTILWHPNPTYDDSGPLTVGLFPVSGSCVATSGATCDATKVTGTGTVYPISGSCGCSSLSSLDVHVDSVSIEKKDGPTGEYAEVHRGLWSDGTWTDTSPESGHEYYYRLREYLDDVYSGYSATAYIYFVIAETFPVSGTAAATASTSCDATVVEFSEFKGVMLQLFSARIPDVSNYVEAHVNCQSTASLGVTSKLSTSGTCVVTSTSSCAVTSTMTVAGTCSATAGASCDTTLIESGTHPMSGTVPVTSSSSCTVTNTAVTSLPTVTCTSDSHLFAIVHDVIQPITGYVFCESAAVCTITKRLPVEGTVSASSAAVCRAVLAYDTFAMSGIIEIVAGSSCKVRKVRPMGHKRYLLHKKRRRYG